MNVFIQKYLLFLTMIMLLDNFIKTVSCHIIHIFDIQKIEILFRSFKETYADNFNINMIENEIQLEN
jgi:hypothetical protein